MIIRGINIFSSGYQGALLLIFEGFTYPKKSFCISATSVHGIMTSTRDYNFKLILQKFYLNLPDGMPIVWYGKLLGFSNISRCYGPDLILSVLGMTSKNKEIKHFLCGGKPGVASLLANKLKFITGNDNLVGTYSPPFKDMSKWDWEDLVASINSSCANVIWVGISTPKQEKFAYELSKLVKVFFLFTVGAAFDIHAGRISQSPRWMQRFGLEWFYRLCKEPRRLWKRYIEIVPKFAILAGVDLIKHYLRKRT